MLSLIFALIVSSHAETKGDDWFCKSQLIAKNKNVWSVCGDSTSLYLANKWEALHSATLTFEMACKQDVECSGHKTIMQPKRLECINDGNLFKCWQMLEYTVLDE